MAVSGRKAEDKSATKTVGSGSCGPCETDGEQLEAYGFCLECGDHLCKDCFRSHGKSKASRHHKLLTIDELSTTDVAQAQSRMCFETCDKHTTEIIKFFCTEHKSVGCSDCLALEHRTCALQYIPEEAEGFRDSIEYKDTECALENEIKKMISSLEDIAITESKIEDMHKECLKYIENFHAQLIEHINKLKDKIILQVNDKKKKNENMIENARFIIQTTLEKALAEVQTTGTPKQNSQLFIRAKKVQSFLQSSKIKANEISLEADGMFYQFKESAALQNVLATSDTLGQLISLNIEGFTEAQEMCDKFSLGSVHVVPGQVPVSTGIIVTNIPEDVTHDGVQVYFENTRRSKGDETSKVELHAEDGYCLVFFKNAEVVSRVCQKADHELRGKHVDVKPYNEYLGLSAALEDLAFTLPEPITLDDQNPHKMKFLQSNSTKRSALENELKKCRAKIFWDPISVQCTIKKDDKVDRKLLQSWPEDTQKCIREFTNNLTVRKKAVDKNVLTEILIQLSQIHLSHPDDVALIVEKENNQIILVALEKVADSVWKDIVKAAETAERIVKEKRKSTTENKELDEWKIAYLKAAHFEEEMVRKYQNIQMRLEDLKVKGRIFLTGPPGIIHTVWITMFERIENVKQHELELEKEQIELLQNEATIEKVKQAMKRKNVPDVWEVKPSCVILYADEEDDLFKMESAIKKTLAKYTINLDSGTEEILKSGRWRTTEQSLKKKFSGCVKIKEKRNQLEIFTLRDIQDEVSDELQSFLTRNARYKEEMTLTRPVVLSFKHVINDKVSKEVHALKSRGLNVDIHLNEKSGEVSLEGTSEGIKEGKRLITISQDSIETEQHTISFPKVRKYFGSSKGKECIEKIEENTPCIIDTQGAGFKRSVHASKTPSTYGNSKTCAEATLKSGVKIFVVSGDMTELPVDVLVNAANKELKHTGGLGRVILNKGGQNIQNECDNRIKTKGPLSEGDVFMSKGGKLKCKFVAHAVGPHWQGGDKDEEFCLLKAIYSSIEKTEKRKLGSIAMPALSVGMFMYPVHRSCMTIVKALYQHFQGTESSIKEVFLCDISKATVDAFINALQAITPNVKVLGRPRSEVGHQDDDDSDDHYAITIYAEDTGKVQKAIKSIETTVKNEWIEKKMEDPGITRFTSEHVKAIEAIAKINHVDVAVDRELGNIRLVGLVTSVSEVVNAIFSQLRNADKSVYMRDQAKLISNVVRWFYLKDQKEIPFPDRVNLTVEKAFKQNDMTVKIKDRSGGEYEIDFGNMTEHDIKKPNDKFPVIRRDLIADASFEIPKNWQKMNDKENLKLVTLNLEDSEYQKVLNEFKKTLGRNPNIVKIERIQNKTLHTRYSAKRKELNITYPKQKDNERMLWHGTADYAVPSINSHGFNRSYCGKNATALGKGVYFAVNANYFDHETYSPVGNDGNKRMYRCLVLTGKYCCGSSNMQVPPPINPAQPRILYDSVTNNTCNPLMFVVFNDTQAYPEHLITYK